MRSSWSAGSFAADRNPIYCLDSFSGYRRASGVWLLPATPFAVTKFKMVGAEEVVCRGKEDHFLYIKSRENGCRSAHGVLPQVAGLLASYHPVEFLGQDEAFVFQEVAQAPPTPWATAAYSVKTVACSEVKGPWELWHLMVSKWISGKGNWFNHL